MAQADGMNGHLWGVEAVPCEIMAKHCKLRRMSDFRQILNEEVAFSCTIPSNHENHLHHDPPMDLTEGLKRHIWGVEATSHKITAKNLIFANFRFRTPSRRRILCYLETIGIYFCSTKPQDAPPGP